MIPDTKEIIRSIQGAWLLARFKPEGMAWFNITADGFWRSFFAAVLLAPFFAVPSAIFYAEATVSLGRYVAADIAHYVLAWIVFPVAMIYVARALNLTDRYVGFIIAYNWSAVIREVVFLPLFLAVAYAGASWAIMFLWLSAGVYFVLIAIFIVRTALGTTLAVGIGITVLDFTLAIALTLTASKLV